MKNTIDIIFALIGVFFAYGGGKWLAKEFKLKSATERNENIKSVLEWAAQASLGAQAFFGSGLVQRQHALAVLKARVLDNGIADKFTDDQLVQYIEQKYTELKANGQLAQVSPLVSDEAYEAAKKEIEGEK